MDTSSLNPSMQVENGNYLITVTILVEYLSVLVKTIKTFYSLS